MGSGIFGLSTRAMQASQVTLDTIAHNISNVNTPGYSRQQVDLETENGLFTGAGFFGRGVTVTTVSRTTNEFLIRENNINVSSAAADETRMNKLAQLEKVLPTGEAGLGYAAQQVLNAFVDVANQPQDMSARQVVLARAQEWVSRVRTAAQQLDELERGTVDDLTSSVNRINMLTSQIAASNQAIATYQGIGHAPNDLLDQRDQLVKDLNKLVQVNTVEADDGSLSVFMGGGQVLVLSNRAETLGVVREAQPDGSSLARVALLANGTSRTLPQEQITGGAVKGLLQVQDVDVAQTRVALNTFVANFADRLNAQQALGMDANGNLQSSFDATTNQPVGTNPLFLNTAKANTITLGLSVPAGLAAASPIVASVNPANKGTASIDSIRMERALPQANALDFATSRPANGAPLTVEFTQTGSTLTYRFLDENGNPYKDVTPARTWTPGTPINDADPAATPPQALFSLRINGVPKGGDKITVAYTEYPGSNNGNAQAMLALRDERIITFGSGPGATTATVTDAYSQMIGDLGVRVQGGKTTAGISATLAKTSEQTLSSATGVNLDEEAAKLIQFQQSYQAAAKVLQVAQSLFDTLLQTARG
jgi:flagellar hook-associated protein 1 FlgK